MARYEHLPIFRAAYDLTVHIEKIARNFSRYHKYTLGTDLRNQSRAILQKIIRANNARDDRMGRLLELRQEIESFKVLARLCQDSGAFASTRSYLHVAERITNLAHFRKASCYRLVERLWQRFPWLEEYYRRDGERIAQSFPPPRPALRITQQRFQFCSRLPGHVVVAQMGQWWEVWGGCPERLLPEGWQRFHENHLATVRRILWQSGLPVAWIRETGRCVTRINERLLACRWPGAPEQRPLSTYDDDLVQFHEL